MSAKRTAKTIKVLLKQKVLGLGEKGEIKKVKAGYFFNFLLPQDLACRLSEKIRQDMAANKTAKKEAEKKKLSQLKKLQERFPASLTFRRRLNEKGKLYQSIKPEEVVERLKAEGLIKKILLPKIDKKGEFKARVLFIDNKKGKITIKVEGSKS